MGRRIWTATTLAISLAAGATAPGRLDAQDLRLDPADPAWVFNGDARAGSWQGRPALLLRTGNALRPDVEFSDGTVEFDMLPTDRRAFLGLDFRVPEGRRGHREDVYLRLHKSKLPDALQYTPYYHGRGQWQLYHDRWATAAAPFVAGEWQHVRVEVAGERAALFVGDVHDPQLVVDRLRTGRTSGFLGFWANFPGATEDDPYTAIVRNVVVRPRRTSYDFSPVQPEPSPPGTITRWSISQAFVREGDDVLQLPVGTLEGPWETVEAEPSGLVPLDLHRERPERGVAAVLAGLELTTSGPRTVRLDLGYSDDVSVFLNGRLLFSARDEYSNNFPRRQGLITPDQASLYLPLQGGSNRVVLAVSEVFGGWGLMGRIEDREDLRIRPLRSR